MPGQRQTCAGSPWTAGFACLLSHTMAGTAVGSGLRGGRPRMLPLHDHGSSRVKRRPGRPPPPSSPEPRPVPHRIIPVYTLSGPRVGCIVAQPRVPLGRKRVEFPAAAAAEAQWSSVGVRRDRTKATRQPAADRFDEMVSDRGHLIQTAQIGTVTACVDWRSPSSIIRSQGPMTHRWHDRRARTTSGRRLPVAIPAIAPAFARI